MGRLSFLIIPLLILGAIGLNSIYIVDEREKALRLWFGEVSDVVEEPGLNFRIPVLHEVVKYDDRILPLDTQPLEVTMRDNRRFEVDAFARWRITDVVRFRRAMGSGGVATASDRLEKILNAELREVLGDVNSSVLLSSCLLYTSPSPRDA